MNFCFLSHEKVDHKHNFPKAKLTNKSPGLALLSQKIKKMAYTSSKSTIKTLNNFILVFLRQNLSSSLPSRLKPAK